MSNMTSMIIDQAVVDIATQIDKLEEELQYNTKGKATEIIDISQRIIKDYDTYRKLTNEYNIMAKKYASTYRAATKGMSRETRKNIDLSGLWQTRNAALAAFEKLNEEKVKKALIKLQKDIHYFQQVINGLSDIKIGMVYILNRNGVREVIDISDLKLEEIVKLDRAALSKGGELKLRYDDAAIARLIDSMSKRKRAKTILQSTIKPDLDNFFKEIDFRWQRAKAVNSSYILWKLNSEWYKAEISAFGDIEETYASIFLKSSITGKPPSFLSEPNIEMQIDSFIKGWVAQVDNTPGSLVEDIYIEGTNQYYGAKSAGASMAGIMPLYRLAQKIIKVSEKQKNRGQFTKKQKESIIRSLSGSSVNTQNRTKIEKVVKPEVIPAIKELEDMLFKKR